MAETWVTVPLDQLARHHEHPGGARAKRCALCNAATAPGMPDEVIEEQIRAHLARRHPVILEVSTGRLPNRARAKLIALGWTPPVIERLEDEGRVNPQTEPPGQQT